MVVSGMKTKNNKRRRVVLSGSTSGTNSTSSRSRCRTRPDRSNVEAKSPDGIDKGMKHIENGCNPTTRLRTRRQKPIPHSEDKQKNLKQRRLKQVRRKNSLSVRNSGREAQDGSNNKLFCGKRTIIGWLVDSGALTLDARVFYMNMAFTRALLHGRITKDGVFCMCCQRILTVVEFESHAGSKLSDPYRNIFIETGINLLRCQVNACEKLDESVRNGVNIIESRPNDSDPNDDTCGICGDGGDLMCCDGCPSTFHKECLGLEKLPEGDWRCSNCRCKICDGRAPSLLACRQCEEKYHQGCGGRIIDPKGFSFCEQSCKKLFDQLQDLVGAKINLGGGYSCYLNQRMDHDSRETNLRQTTRITCNSKLAVTQDVMEECFNPIVDPRTHVDIMRSVIFNCSANLNRLNYSGFYTATLESGDEIISAASIRIHGIKLAEMPFIGTRNNYRCQGMCRRLLRAVESVLHFLGVKKLIIPSISERVEKWKNGYGFKPIEESLKQELRSMNLLTFPDTVLLQKTPMDGYGQENE